jgi:Nif-specific regulatory protein
MEPSPAFLLVLDPAVGHAVVPLYPGQTCTIGRGPTNSIVLHDERSSRFHAEVMADAGGWVVRDVGSRNGTIVRGEPIDGHRALVPGDTIRIGGAQLVFGEGEPPSDVSELSDEATETCEVTSDMQKWSDAITLRRDKTRLLDDIGESAGSVPRVGKAAASLCRLAFALARASDVAEVARLALEAAIEGAGAVHGVVLLPPSAPAAEWRHPKAVASLVPAAAAPPGWPAEGGLPAGAVATVLATNEAILVGRAPRRPAAGAVGGGRVDDSASAISAPVRVGGRPVGVLHVELAVGSRQATPDDLEFVMAVCDALGIAVENLSTRERLSVRLASTADENERLRQRLREESRMVGGSPALSNIASQIARVASTKATVLVRGESGSGKELVARAIHDASDRRSAAFICLNCAALTETLLESELFGHEKGAFTGATERKAGKFEAAHRGTLFLDEIGEMSQTIQAKFLRVLEGHSFERVGGSQRVQVDVRVVAATNRNLEDAVAANEFRRDLYFRLKVVEIIVPPLRRRREDIEPLARHFLARFAAETGRAVHDFTPAALESLLAYQWPGNIRELRNCIERAVVLSNHDTIDTHDLALSQLVPAGDTGRGTGRGTGVRNSAFVPQTIEELERRHIMGTLAAVGGNKTKAAAMLGIERSTLDRKLTRWAKRL